MTGMSSAKQAWSEGGLVFAAVMMILLGTMQFFQGLAAITRAGWARGIGIALVVLSAIANFFYIPYSPCGRRCS